MLAPVLIAVVLNGFLATASAESEWRADLLPALKQAASEKKLALVDFQAPWCYSCYYMEQHVLSGERFAFAATPLILVKLDVDTEDGRAFKEKYGVTMLPTYLLVDGKGREKGRILGEQTELDFMNKLIALERGGEGASEEDDLKDKLERVKRGDLDALEKALDAPPECETAYFVGYGAKALEKADSVRRARVLAAEKTALEAVVTKRVFVDADRRCADFRTPVEELADVYEALSLPEKRKELLSRAAETMLAQGQTGEDRNRDDNARFFLTLLEDDTRLRSFYKQLIVAYPSDYVYSYRYAKWLQERGKSQDALPWIE